MSTATAKYEKLFPHRYFKFKFTEQASIRFGILEEMDLLPLQKRKMYDAIGYGTMIHNFTPIYETISALDVIELPKGGELPTILDVILAPVDISTLSKVKGFVSSGFYDATETIILSAAPKLSLSTSLSFLSMDLVSGVGICLFAFVTSLLLTHKLWYAILTQSRVKFNQVFTRYLIVLWDVFSVLFFEPYPGQLGHISERLAYAFWVIGVTFIGFLMSCFLQSEFCSEKYLFIETIEDLQYMQSHANVQPLMIKDGLVYHFLSGMAQKEEGLYNWMKNNLNEENFCDPYDLVSPDMYQKILGGHKALILNKLLLSATLGYVLMQDMDMISEWKTKLDGFYFSKSLKSDYIVLPANSSLFSNPNFRENYEKGMLVFFETKAFSYFDFPGDYAMDFVKWERPTKVASDLTLFAVSSVFYLILSALTVCVAMLFVEIIFGWKKYRIGKSTNQNVSQKSIAEKIMTTT